MTLVFSLCRCCSPLDTICSHPVGIHSRFSRFVRRVVYTEPVIQRTSQALQGTTFHNAFMDWRTHCCTHCHC